MINLGNSVCTIVFLFCYCLVVVVVVVLLFFFLFGGESLVSLDVCLYVCLHF